MDAIKDIHVTVGKSASGDAKAVLTFHDINMAKQVHSVVTNGSSTKKTRMAASTGSSICANGGSATSAKTMPMLAKTGQSGSKTTSDDLSVLGHIRPSRAMSMTPHVG